ncbi:SGNH/GDSL hydrolase family protein [Actinacidiphila sp. bgisy144]|uniref:SGNH/GDSL hydrolase family protein n=1 Tax=Actinacidiphila sp. bgisy144 TaxID=3413791 RepID=UPI003EBFCD87
MCRTTVIAYALALTAALVGAGVACTDQDHAGASAKPADAASSKGPYVALGDSYTAAPDVPGQTAQPPGCQRSDANYPSDIAGGLGLTGTRFVDMSCSGATVDDLTSSQHTSHGTNPPQELPLSSRTRLVTLGIGGNDIEFTSILKECITMDAADYAIGIGHFALPDACKRRYNLGGTDQLQQRINAIAPDIAHALKDIHRKAPRARILVIGYPTILPSGTTNACTRSFGLSPDDTAYLHHVEDSLNTMLRQQAKAANVRYIDTATPSKNYTACDNRDTRWIEPPITQNAAASVHPNARGESGMATAALEALRK